MTLSEVRETVALARRKLNSVHNVWDTGVVQAVNAAIAEIDRIVTRIDSAERLEKRRVINAKERNKRP